MKKTRTLLFGTVLSFWMITTLLPACSKNETNTPDYRHTALQFTQLLAAREYQRAYAMTSQEYQKKTRVEQLQKSFETIVPASWKNIGPIAVGQTMSSWPGKLPDDVGWAYVSIGGDMYSEAVTVVVSSESGALKIRTIEFGRP